MSFSNDDMGNYPDLLGMRSYLREHTITIKDRSAVLEDNEHILIPIKNRRVSIYRRYRLLINKLTLSKRYTEGVKVCKEAVNYFPVDIFFHLQLGHFYARIDEFRLAIKSFEKGFEIANKNLPGFIELLKKEKIFFQNIFGSWTFSHNYLKQYQSTVTVINKALMLRVGMSANMHANLSSAYYHLHEWKKAQEEMNSAIRRNSQLKEYELSKMILKGCKEKLCLQEVRSTQKIESTKQKTERPKSRLCYDDYQNFDNDRVDVEFEDITDSDSNDEYLEKTYDAYTDENSDIDVDGMTNDYSSSCECYSDSEDFNDFDIDDECELDDEYCETEVYDDEQYDDD